MSNLFPFFHFHFRILICWNCTWSPACILHFIAWHDGSYHYYFSNLFFSTLLFPKKIIIFNSLSFNPKFSQCDLFHRNKVNISFCRQIFVHVQCTYISVHKHIFIYWFWLLCTQKMANGEYCKSQMIKNGMGIDGCWETECDICKISVYYWNYTI